MMDMARKVPRHRIEQMQRQAMPANQAPQNGQPTVAMPQFTSTICTQCRSPLTLDPPRTVGDTVQCGICGKELLLTESVQQTEQRAMGAFVIWAIPGMLIGMVCGGIVGTLVLPIIGTIIGGFLAGLSGGFITGIIGAAVTKRKR